jgi:hypothetical protein|eukprot:COSAG01_NODE_1149_length_11506_cov_141.610049_7_plen_253_part_00
MQSLSTGILYTLIGVATYLTCDTEALPPACSVDQTSSSAMLASEVTTPGELCEASPCNETLLATMPTFFLTMVLFVVNVVWVWVAFILVIGIHKRAIADSKDRLQTQVLQGHLRRTRRIFIYDVCCFTLCLGIVCAYSFDPLGWDLGGGSPIVEQQWKFRQLLFWNCVLYSLLSLPFVLFALPLMNLLFSKAAATGYDRDGTLRTLNRETNAAVEAGETSTDVMFANPMLTEAAGADGDEEVARETSQARDG